MFWPWEASAGRLEPGTRFGTDRASEEERAYSAGTRGMSESGDFAEGMGMVSCGAGDEVVEIWEGAG